MCQTKAYGEKRAAAYTPAATSTDRELLLVMSKQEVSASQRCKKEEKTEDERKNKKKKKKKNAKEKYVTMSDTQTVLLECCRLDCVEQLLLVRPDSEKTSTSPVSFSLF